MLFLGMSLGAWITIGVILFVILTQLLTNMSTDAVYLLSMLILVLSGVLSPEQTFTGLIAPSTLFLLFFFIVVECLQNTGALSLLTRHLFGKHHNMSISLLRMMLPTAVFSSFISNPSVGQMMYEPVAEWGRRYKVAPSKLLLPVAYVIGMAGACTIIGYPVNLIVFGFCENATGQSYNIFTPFIGGAICTLVCMMYVLCMRRRLPACSDPKQSLIETENYIVEMLVPTNNDAVLKTVQEAGLAQLDCGHLVSIVRFDHYVIAPVSPDEHIFGGDRLVFSGHIESLMELRDKKGFANSTKHVFDLNKTEQGKKNLQIFSVPPKSPLKGKRLLDTDFEDKHRVTLVALLHAGKYSEELPRGTVLETGDMLLFEGEKVNLSSFNDILTPHKSSNFVRPNWRTWVSVLVTILIILLPALGIVPLLTAVFAAAMLLCVLRCCNRLQAWSSINWSLIVMMTGAFTLSLAMKESGLAENVSNAIIGFCGTDTTQALIVVTAITILMTQFVFDASVVSVMIPIAVELSSSIGVDVLPMAMAVLLGTACNFTTHISTAHMIAVYPVGGFRLANIFRFGLPLCFVMFVTIILVVKLFYPF